ncbi:MAG TPA: S8 family serine peptidase, partial [Candidatus Acidoferrum sp.]|nr:S8 family serine peptidase [Candidatus Acidoferrum sp.]
ENIWTSTPYMSSSTDTSFAGNCAASTEYQEAGNCRTLIAGTSMATPHVAGAAALILSATGGASSVYASPAAMFTLLCNYADNISDPHQGCGRLNVYRAMAQALSDPNPPT